MRKHRIIRQEIVPPNTSFQYNIETEEFAALMVTWDNAGGIAAPTLLVFCPTACLASAPSAAANFPGVPAVPAAGAVAYAAIGLGAQIAFPIPSLVTIGVVNSATSAVTVRIEGDEHESMFPNPEEGMQKNRA
jgi:hypothetical protein